MEYNQKIDVIIPAYNVPDTILFRCLSSIACQENIEDIEVTIIDDASTEQNYEEIASKFDFLFKTNIIRLPVNGGPGVARQRGINCTHNEYITFIDADDTLANSYSLKILKYAIEDNPYNVVSLGNFEEEIKKDGEFLSFASHKKDYSWIFGKMYKRAFIEKYNIHFHPTSRANEDGGFNQQVQFCLNEYEREGYIDEVVYYWHYSETSITTVNNNDYEFSPNPNGGFFGYVENAIFNVERAKEINIDPANIKSYTISCMIHLYLMWIKCCQYANKYADRNLKLCKWYYNETYKNLEITTEELEYYYGEIMFMNHKNGKFIGFIPQVSYYQFLDMLKE